MEPTEEQFLIFNALDTLSLIQIHFYDPLQGYWYIQTPSRVLPIAVIAAAGEIYPLDFLKDDDDA